MSNILFSPLRQMQHFSAITQTRLDNGKAMSRQLFRRQRSIWHAGLVTLDQAASAEMPGNFTSRFLPEGEILMLVSGTELAGSDHRFLT